MQKYCQRKDRGEGHLPSCAKVKKTEATNTSYSCLSFRVSLRDCSSSLSLPMGGGGRCYMTWQPPYLKSWDKFWTLDHQKLWHLSHLKTTTTFVNKILHSGFCKYHVNIHHMLQIYKDVMGFSIRSWGITTHRQMQTRYRVMPDVNITSKFGTYSYFQYSMSVAAPDIFCN